MFGYGHGDSCGDWFHGFDSQIFVSFSYFQWFSISSLDGSHRQRREQEDGEECEGVFHGYLSNFEMRLKQVPSPGANRSSITVRPLLLSSCLMGTWQPSPAPKSRTRS